MKTSSNWRLSEFCVLTCQQGAACTAGKMYVQVTAQQLKAARRHRALNLCGLTASAQLWQKQPACDNSSWVDREAVRVTDALTDTTGFSSITEHVKIPHEHTYTHEHNKGCPQHVQADRTHTDHRTGTIQSSSHVDSCKHTTNSQVSHTPSAAATCCDKAPGDGMTVVTQCPWGQSFVKTRTTGSERSNMYTQGATPFKIRDVFFLTADYMCHTNILKGFIALW